MSRKKDRREQRLEAEHKLHSDEGNADPPTHSRFQYVVPRTPGDSPSLIPAASASLVRIFTLTITVMHTGWGIAAEFSGGILTAKWTAPKMILEVKVGLALQVAAAAATHSPLQTSLARRSTTSIVLGQSLTALCCCKGKDAYETKRKKGPLNSGAFEFNEAVLLRRSATCSLPPASLRRASTRLSL